MTALAWRRPSITPASRSAPSCWESVGWRMPSFSSISLTAYSPSQRRQAINSRWGLPRSLRMSETSSARPCIPAARFFRPCSVMSGLQPEIPVGLPGDWGGAFPVRRHQRRRDQYRIALTPPLRREYTALVAGLQRRQQPQKLIDAAADVHRVPDDGADHSLRIDDESGAYRGAGVRAGVQHPIGPRHRHRGILDDRKRHFDAEAFLDVRDPGDVREDAVDGKPEQIAAQFLKPIIGLGERNELTRADGREVGRVSEEDQPAS